jgi:AcrR family transcriptional regulator
MSLSTSERIEAATLALLTEHGIAGITMSAIAAEAGVSRQTLYTKYGDIETVVYAATGAHQRQSAEHLATVLLTIESPTDRLEHLARHGVALAGHGHRAIRDGFSDGIRQAIAEHDRAMSDLIAATLDDGKQSNEFRQSLDIETDSMLIQSMIEAGAELASNAPEDLTRIVNATVTSVLAAVTAD